MPETLTDFLRHPLTGLTALLGTLGGALDLLWAEPLWQVLVNSSGQLFQILSLTGFTLAPRVEFLPEGWLTTAALVVGVVYVGKLTYSYLDRTEDALDDT